VCIVRDVHFAVFEIFRNFCSSQLRVLFFVFFVLGSTIFERYFILLYAMQTAQINERNGGICRLLSRLTLCIFIYHMSIISVTVWFHSACAAHARFVRLFLLCLMIILMRCT